MHINKAYAACLTISVAAIIWALKRRRREQTGTVRLRAVAIYGWPLEGPIGKVLD